MAEQRNDPVPSFDDGERKPSPIESTTNDNVRKPIPSNPAGKSRDTADDRDTGPTATMPPEEAGNPDRNTM